VPVRIRKNLDT